MRCYDLTNRSEATRPTTRNSWLSALLDCPLGRPPKIGLAHHPVRCGKRGQPAVAIGRIDTAGPPDLHLVFGAEPDRLPICFFQVVGAVHSAPEARAVPDPQHMRRLVYGCLHSAAEEGPGIAFRVAHAV